MRIGFVLLAALPFFPATVFGWGCEGHDIVALIARAHLTPAASAGVDQLLRDYPVDPSLDRYCKVRPADLMGESSSWADDMKNPDKNGVWHYVDIPLAAVDGDAMQWCPPIGPSVDGGERTGCILNGIDLEISILRDGTQPGELRARAVRYIIHLLGDITEPLHDVDNHDQGGNCRILKFFSVAAPVNLHTLWDSRMLSDDTGKRKLSEAQYAAGIDQDFNGRWAEWGSAKFDSKAWAWEGHDLAVRIVYGALKPSIPMASVNAGDADKETCDAERDADKENRIRIGAAYEDQAIPVIRQQLAKAGYRLAGLLNSIF